MSNNLPAKRQDSQRQVRSRNNRMALPLAATLAIGVGAGLAVGLTFLLLWLLLGVRPGDPLSDASGAVLDVIKVALAVVAGLGGTIGLVVAYRRQKHLELDEAGTREEENAFRNRYGAAAQQLGDAEPSVRLAGVYAMARLADEWGAQQQQCVDVLCAYLRLPWSGLDGEVGTSVVERSWTEADGSQRMESHTVPARHGETEVRRTLVRVIATHLRPDAAVSWSNLEFNFRSANLPDVDFSRAVFSGPVDFQKTAFSGSTDFGNAIFAGLTRFDAATFSGEDTKFSEAIFSSTYTSFREATFSGRDTRFYKATFSSEHTIFRHAVFASNNWTNFASAKFTGWTDFVGVTFSGEFTSFGRATFSGQRTDFDGTKFTAAGTDFENAMFTGGSVQFVKATFSSTITKFFRADFTGGFANFKGVTASGKNLSFNKANFSDVTFEDAKFSNEDITCYWTVFRRGRPPQLEPFCDPPLTESSLSFRPDDFTEWRA